MKVRGNETSEYGSAHGNVEADLWKDENYTRGIVY
jgi:hypothetical protein